MRPEIRATETEIRMRCRLVPEHLILQLVTLRVVIDDQTFEVLRTLVHDLAEGVEIRKHARILIVQLATIVNDVLSQNEDVVNVCSQGRWNAHRVLHGDDEHGVDVAPVHEEIAHIAVANPGGVEQTVVQNQEVARIYGGGALIIEILRDLLSNELLALENIGDDQRSILLVDEHRGNDLAVELIGALRTGYHRSARKTLVMPQQVLDEEGLAGFALSDEHYHLVVFDLRHIEFPELEIESLGTTGGL